MYARQQADGLLQRSVEAAEVQRKAKNAAAAAVEAAFDRMMADEARRMQSP